MMHGQQNLKLNRTCIVTKYFVNRFLF